MRQGSVSYSPAVPLFRAQPGGCAMRRLVRARASKAFLTNDGTWTPRIAAAAAFGTFSAVFAATRPFHSEEVEIYYSFDDRQRSQWDFAISAAGI